MKVVFPHRLKEILSMNIFPRRVADNILPLSVACTLPAAFQEWHFTGKTVDHESDVETCHLCDKKGLRYHFEIKNDQTGHCLDVGSECILKFQVAVFDEGRELGKDEARKVLNNRIRQMRLESCLRALERLAAAETKNKILSSALLYYKIHKSLTPKFANVVFWRLQSNSIDHDPTFFKIRLDKAQYVSDLGEMPPRNVHRIWKAMTPAQRKKAIELGHSAPI